MLLKSSNNGYKKNVVEFKSLWFLVSQEGGVRACGDAVLRYFWCGFAVIFILTRGIAVSKH